MLRSASYFRTCDARGIKVSRCETSVSSRYVRYPLGIRMMERSYVHTRVASFFFFFFIYSHFDLQVRTFSLRCNLK